MPDRHADGFRPIEDCGAIGDMRTAALVSIDGVVDFMCFPRFDSPSVFAALLDPERGGFFSLGLSEELGTRKQIYLPSTNILLTRLHTVDALVEIADFMPTDGTHADGALVRQVRAVRGDARVRARCAPRFDYGRARHRATGGGGDDVVFAPDDDTLARLALRASVPLIVDGDDAVAEFDLPERGTQTFVLYDPDAAPARLDGDLAAYAEAQFAVTAAFWQEWAERSRYGGRWPGIVERSALLLKLLISAEHGSMVAAPTFALPEELGGERNWDYRFTWIRDSAFALHALIKLGYGQESVAFMHWLARICSREAYEGELQVLYGLDGTAELAEQPLDSLRGYADSRPVRIGNAAAGQYQLDIYGELLDAVFLSNCHVEPLSDSTWRDVTKMVDYVAGNWSRPDRGIWEVRGGQHEFLHSRLMCWVALDRGLRIAEDRSLPAPVAEWRRQRDVIYESIHTEFWDGKMQAFVQRKGARELDAACLLMPIVKFISPTDPKWLSTLKAIGERLVRDTQVYRYEASGFDGLEGIEGTFSACAFWYIQCLSMAGEVERARVLFEKMVGYANHVGLFAEELGPCGEHLGNFPQALTHLALISAAHRLEQDLRLRRAGRH